MTALAAPDDEKAIKVRPKLRAVEVIHYRNQGRDMLCLRDPLQYADSQLHVSPDVFLIASLFDGAHDFEAIQAEFSTRFGARVARDDVKKVVDALEDAHLLEGPQFEEYRERIEQAYREQDVRPSTLAGSCYPEDPRDVPAFLDGLFVREGGPGTPRERPGDAAPLRGLLVPHVDLRRGGVAFAHAYKAMLESPAPQSVVVLGTAHASRGELFTLTRKSFETPLGTLETDGALVDRLAAAAGPSAFAEEYVHKGEHSIEIQAIWLQHLLAPHAPKIVPVLCGPVRESIDEGVPPLELGAMRPFVDELAGIMRAHAGRVVVIASADLAHIGQKFGDEVPLTPRLIRKNEEEDRKMLELVEAGDADGFIEFVRREKDRRKVCGLTSIYVLLAACAAAGAPARGTRLFYETSPEPETASLVSYASMAFA